MLAAVRTRLGIESDDVAATLIGLAYENGQFTVTLAHDEQFEVFGLPEGTTVEVIEQAPGAGFNLIIWITVF